MKKILNVFLIAFCTLTVACNSPTLASYPIEINFAETNNSTIVSGKIEPNVKFGNLTLPTIRSKYNSYIANARIFRQEVIGSILCELGIEIISSEKATDGIILHTKSDLGLGSFACFQGRVSYSVIPYQSLVYELSSQDGSLTESSSSKDNTELISRFTSLLRSMQIEVGVVDVQRFNGVSYLENDVEKTVDCVKISAVYQIDGVGLRSDLRSIENGYDFYLQSGISAIYVQDKLAWLDISGIYEPNDADEITIISFDDAVRKAAERLNNLVLQEPIEIIEVQFCYLPQAITKNNPLLVNIRPTWCFRIGNDFWIYIDAISGQEML